jgi:hypothetical protein
MNAILQMLQLNTVVLTIKLPDAFDKEAVVWNSILPSFFEVQPQAVKRADPSIRPQILGRAFRVVQYNSDLAFRFLSENVPAFVRMEEDDGDGEGCIRYRQNSYCFGHVTAVSGCPADKFSMHAVCKTFRRQHAWWVHEAARVRVR